MTTALRLKKNKNLLEFSEHEHNILKKNTSIKCSVFSMFVIECISFCSSLVLSISLFRILLPLNLLFTQVNPVFFCPFYSIFLLLFFFTTIQKYHYSYHLFNLIKKSGWFKSSASRTMHRECMVRDAGGWQDLGFFPLICFDWEILSIVAWFPPFPCFLP